eukprot:gb/GECG01006732.1/.p1 GENE.gb/GECG01006732.1/~~gb/GECG01006732.1/.p1  ORF type:complete len:326 (+),score=49.68 gb/GECG01006732.1/:1-978(+)
MADGNDNTSERGGLGNGEEHKEHPQQSSTHDVHHDDRSSKNDSQKKKEYTKKTKEAQEAYKKGDIEATIAAHDQNPMLAEESHGGAGSDVIKSIVFGGIDGSITVFAVVAAVRGSGLGVEVLMLMSIAALIGDAISMGFGDFLSSTAETDHVWVERAREKWEYENYPEGEKQEMVDIYIKKGFDPEDAKLIIDTYTKKPEYADAFIDHMMVEELGFMVPEKGALATHAKEGLITFCSFVFFGSVPLWFYALLYFTDAHTNENDLFGIACAATFVTLYGLGVVQGKLTGGNKIKSGLEMAITGALAAASAFVIGLGLENAFGLNDC